MQNGKRKVLRKDAEISLLSSKNGWVSGYVSTWDREPDAYGDVVKRGAFAHTLEDWSKSGRPIPLLFNHNQSIGDFIGHVSEIYENDFGLHCKAEFDDTPEAQRVRQLVADGRLAKFSFAYTVVDQGRVTLPDGRKANELREVALEEVSIVLTPANRHADITDFKRKSDENEELEAAVAYGKALLAALDALYKS